MTKFFCEMRGKTLFLHDLDKGPNQSFTNQYCNSCSCSCRFNKKYILRGKNADLDASKSSYRNATCKTCANKDVSHCETCKMKVDSRGDCHGTPTDYKRIIPKNIEYIGNNPEIKKIIEKVDKEWSDSHPNLVIGKDGGKKSDKNKVELRLLFDAPDALDMIARVMMYGRDKYGRKNWKEVLKERYENAELRHYSAVCKGKEWDVGPEGTQQLHLANLACNAIFLLQLKIDDLKPIKSKPECDCK